MTSPSNLTDDGPVTSTVVADILWTVPHHAPEISLSFNGVNEPTGLFDALRAIGWDVPSSPPPPGNAIVWTPDPVTGADHTIKPWRVQEFRPRPGAWTKEETRAIGPATIEALRSFRVEMIGLREDMSSLATAPQSAAAASPQPVAANPASASGAISTVPAGPETAGLFVLLVDPTDGLNLEVPQGIELRASHCGRKQVPWGWAESYGPVDVMVDHAEMLAALKARGGYAWSATKNAELPGAQAASSTLVQMVVPGGSADDKKLQKVLNILDGAHSVPLIPIGEGEPALFVWTEVAPQNVAMLTSTLRLRVPNGIINAPN